MPTPTEQLYSRTSYAGDGVTTAWNFTFAGGYLDKSHVKAYTLTPAGVRTELAVLPGDFLGEYQLSIVPAVPLGTQVTIYRDTPKDAPLVDFADGGNLKEAALDTATKQTIFAAAENAAAAVPATPPIRASADVASPASPGIFWSEAASPPSGAPPPSWVVLTLILTSGSPMAQFWSPTRIHRAAVPS